MSEDRGAWPVDGALLALVALAAATIAASRTAGFTTDSDAYLDVAANLLAGRGLVQNVVDFWRPALPDPLGMWPPLYPALVAGVAAFGMPLEAAARAVSITCFAAFAFAFHALSSRILGRGLAALVVLLVLSIPGVVRLGAFAWSETTMLAFAAAGLALLAPSSIDDRTRLTVRAAILAGACLGLAVLARHAALAFLLVGGLVVVRGRGPSRARLAFLGAALTLPAAWMLRNLALFGRPFGPALPTAATAPTTQGFEMLRALRWELVPAFFADRPWIVFPVLGLFALGVGLALRAGGGARLAALTAAALLGITLLATSLMAINAPTGRYLAPALPFLVLAAVAGLAGPGGAERSRRSLVTAGVAMLALAGGVQLLGLAGTAGSVRAERLERRADRAALASLLADGEGPVLSDRGHLARLASGRAAVQIPPAAYRPRDYGVEDDARWAAAGVNEAVMAGGAAPPAGVWTPAGTAGRFTLWRRPRP